MQEVHTWRKHTLAVSTHMQEAHTCSPAQGGTDTTQCELKQGKSKHASTMSVCLSVASAQMPFLMSSGEIGQLM